MELFTQLFILFISLSMYLVFCTKMTDLRYVQIATGYGIFIGWFIGKKYKKMFL
jgi:hypothetical protein